MKKNILVTVFIIITLNLFSQSLNLLHKDRVWSTLIKPGWREDIHLTTCFIMFYGDTTIQTLIYTKVLESYDSLQTTWKMVGFVREETQTGLFFRNLEGREELLYDYNLQVNDTFTIVNTQYIFDTVTFIVKEIDSVLLINKFKRRIHLSHLENPNRNLFWIEDIGSFQGILYDMDFAGGAILQLLCCYEKDVILYKNSDYDNCYYFTPTEINDKLNLSYQFNLFPNPVTGSSEIRIKGLQQEATLTVYNSTGAIVINESIVTDSYSRLVSNKELPAGIYMVTLNVNDTVTQTLKMVVVK